MTERSSGGEVGFPVVLNGLLLFATLAGGYLLVSSKLTSDRPVTPPGKPPSTIGGQTVETRLWEDPLHARENGRERVRPDLSDEIKAHNADGDGVLLLPVMIPGGPYSEDQESRIRSRFAIVSALGRSGYAPEDAEHIGELEMKWPTTRELKQWKTNPQATLEVSPPYDRSENVTTNNPSGRVVAMDQVPTNAAIGSVDLRVRYEWYRPRVFHPRSTNTTQQTNILVLWLDDGMFEDDPLLRFPLFLTPLITAIDPDTNATSGIVRLIGPRSSTTLRAMLPDEFSEQAHQSFSRANSNLWKLATKTLGRITLYSPTANAMDEVLVSNAASATPRQTVRDKLNANGFRDAHFFNATDAQLADEIIHELKLRDTDLHDPKQHLVLLSEWDTFYGRMLSLTYGLAMQTKLPPGEFVKEYRAGRRSLPSNFHSFVYLRGLDGRTVVGGGEPGGDKLGQRDRSRAKPESIGVQV